MINSAYYDRLWGTMSSNLHYTEKMRITFFVDAIRERIGDSHAEILDLGCGRGWMAPFLSPFGAVTGVDFSPKGVQFANEHYGDHGTFFLGDAASEALGLPEDRTYDFVVNSEVIEHVPDQQQFIEQLKRFLKPNGWLLLTTPNGNVWREFSTDRRAVHSLQPVELWLEPSRLSQLLRAAGFAIEVHEGLPTYDFRLGRHRWLQRRFWRRLFTRLGLAHKYGRFLLMDALFQAVVARNVVQVDEECRRAL